ncbi:MAG: glutamyl-tRNA reductase [Peptococcaceae bacterium]|nr:glutamyl-tRNA reductase [Peptococcaceae bacterium]
MKIEMIGIDHSTASLAQREVFAFTSTQAHLAMQSMVQNFGVSGSVIVSTCNRTELWVSKKDDNEIDLTEILCQLKQVCPEEYIALLKVRKGLEAVRHLFETASGLKSQIWGEDQILAQIKSSIECARTAGTTDQILEKLFQTAITAAKRIKTEVRLTSADVSVATRAIEVMKEHFPDLSGLECLVIGNGEMGRMVSAMLAKSSAKVTVTRRKYKNGASPVPNGCASIEYEKRIEMIKRSDIIVSATSSPHYTIKMGDAEEILKDGKKRLFVDLAVPRDLDPALGGWPNVTLLDSDRLGCSFPEDVQRDSLVRTHQILDEYMEEYIKWVKARELIPLINGIAQSASEKIKGYLSKDIVELSMDDERRILFEQKLAGVTAKTVRSILYKMKDVMDDKQWEECFSNLAADRREQ